MVKLLGHLFLDIHGGKIHFRLYNMVNLIFLYENVLFWWWNL